MKEDRQTRKSPAAEQPKSQRPKATPKKTPTGTVTAEPAGKGAGAAADARIHDHLKRTEQEMAVIAEIGRVIGSTLNIEKVYERFAAETRKLIPFDSLNVTLSDPQSDILKLAYMNGMAIEGRKPGHSIPREGSLTEELIRTRTGFIVNVTSLEALIERFPAAANNHKAGVRSVLCVPLLSGGEVIGGLNFRSKRIKAYTERDLSLAQRIGDQIA
nr:GAF domain-containing protein [Deltaproteobacteria bacterium]